MKASSHGGEAAKGRRLLRRASVILARTSGVSWVTEKEETPLA